MLVLSNPRGHGYPMMGRTVVDHCRTAWADLMEFTCSAAIGAIVHALAQLRSHYPSVDLQWVASGYVQGKDAEKIAKLEDDADEPAKRLAEDVELFNEGGVVPHS